MKVMKFGGTSLGTPERMRHVAKLTIGNNERKWVVLSAVSGTTNSLYEIVEVLRSGDQDQVDGKIDNLEALYSDYIPELFVEEESRNAAWALVMRCFKTLRQTCEKAVNEESEKLIVGQGELISTSLFSVLLEELKVHSKLVQAMDFMQLNDEGEPAMSNIRKSLLKLDQELSDIDIIITQGFLSKDAKGRMDNLQRGGSDFSAAIIGACLNSDEVEIWTDIDGMHNNDPRVVKKTRPILKLTFNEAAELAYFGAKVLHPYTILPAREYNIPVRIKNTLNPDAEGTVISRAKPGWKGGAKAVAAKDGIVAIKIRSSRMLMAYGFLRKVFEVFENFKTPIDMVTTSEVAVSITVDNTRHLMEIISSLEPFGEVEVDYEMTIICIVGNGIAEDQGTVSKIFHSLNDIQIRMISYGGSRNNISLLVKTSLKQSALECLNKGVFGL